jgi:hypothetical protein
VFNQFGDLERGALCSGNVHSADGWEGVLKPVVERYQGKVARIYFRADAAFAMPEVYEYLEAERIKYAIRLPPRVGPGQDFSAASSPSLVSEVHGHGTIEFVVRADCEFGNVEIFPIFALFATECSRSGIIQTMRRGDDFRQRSNRSGASLARSIYRACQSTTKGICLCPLARVRDFSPSR